MTIVGLLCGADDWDSIVLCAECKEDWLRQHLKLPGGIPSHDTFNRIYSLLDPAEFRDLFTRWVKDMLIDTPLSGVVALDGKTVRGSRDKSSSAIHMVNAWSTEAGISLGQYKVDPMRLPQYQNYWAIQGCLVYAMSCQKRIADKILKSRADYLLAVKNNQRKLYGELDQHFSNYWQENPTDSPDQAHYGEQLDKGHGRNEHRRCWVLNDLSTCPNATRWKAKTVAAVQLDRAKGNKGRSFIRYFISSKAMTADEVLKATRLHLEISKQEKSPHNAIT